MDYKILSQTGDHVIVSLNEKVAYTLSPSAFKLAELAIKGGGNPEEVFALQASQTANSVKAFDPEKAKKEAEKAKKAKAIADFNDNLANHVWSNNVFYLADQYATAKKVVDEVADYPIVIDLADYQESANKQTLPGQYRFCDLTFGETNVPSITIGLNASLPIVSARNDAKEARLSFQIAAHEETMTFVSPVLNSEVKRDCFDVNDVGNVVYSAEIKAKGVRGPGNGGGKKRPIKHIESGSIYESQTEAASAHPEEIGEVKYPHAKVASLAKQGKIFEYV